MRVLALALYLTSSVTAFAACDVKGARIEEALAARKAFQESAHKQTVRDLRTLRDAAIVLEAFKFDVECARLIEIVRSLIANPEQAIEQGGDTDEERADKTEEARQPKAPEAVEPSALRPR